MQARLPRPWLLAQPDPAGEQAVLAPGIEVGKEDGDSLADQSAAVDDDAEPAQRQPRVLKVEQFAGGQVDSDLVVMPFPASRRAFTCDDWLRDDGA